MEPICFFGGFLQKVVITSFSDSVVQKTTQHSDGSCNDTSYSQLLFKFFTKHSLHFCKNIQKNIVSKEYWIAHHDVKLCYLPNCKYHLFWVTLKSYYRNLTHLVSHFNIRTVSIHCSSIDSLKVLLSRVVKCSILCKEQFTLFNEAEEWRERMPSFSKRRLLRKRYRKHFLSSFRKTKSTQTSG